MSSLSTSTIPAPGMTAYRAPSLFQPHRVRQALRDAHEGRIPPLISIAISLSSIPNIRFIAPMGYDAVFLEWEHASCSVETMTSMVHELMFMSEGKTIPFVRVPGHDHASIGWVLDAGGSVIVPQVDTVEQAKHVVSATKFGTKARGNRSVPPFRWIPGLTDGLVDQTKTFHENQNEQAAIVIQVERLEALDNLDAILTEVPQIDAVMMGRLDFRTSMDLPAMTGGEEPEWLDVEARFQRITDKHNKPRVAIALFPAARQMAVKNNTAMQIVTGDTIALAGLINDLASAKRDIQDYKSHEKKV